MRVSFCTDCPKSITTPGFRGLLKQRCPDCEKVHRRETFKASKMRMRRAQGAKPQAPKASKPEKRKPIPYAGFDFGERN